MGNNIKNNKNLWIIVIAVLLIIIAVYFYYSSNSVKEAASPTAPTTTTNTPKTPSTPQFPTVKSPSTTKASVTSPAATLKTFSDSGLTFSFKYPSTWSNPIKSVRSGTVLLDFRNGLTIEAGGFGDAKGNPLTEAQMVASLSDSAYGTPVNRLISVTTITVAGKKSSKATYFRVSDNLPQTQVFLTNRSSTDLIVVTDRNNLISAAVLNQILGTIVLK